MGNALDLRAEKEDKDAPPENVVPYLPRIRSYKRRRSNSLPIKPKNPMRILPLTDVNSRQYAWRRSDYFCPEMIPEPDYSDEDEAEGDENTVSSEANLEIEEVTAKQDTRRRPQEDEKSERMAATKPNAPPTKDPSPNVSDEGLVVPKKPYNPYLESSQRQKLCKELKFKQKHGKSNFNPRSELQIAMEKYQEEKLRKAMESAKKSSLERILEQQARKIEQEKDPVPRRPSWIDRLQEQQDSWTPSDPRTEEFYRVHARVMSHQNGESHSGSSSRSTGEETTATVDRKYVRNEIARPNPQRNSNGAQNHSRT